MLLRRAVAVLRRAGHVVTLLAPSDAGSLLVGPDLARALLPWESRDLTALFDQATPATGRLADLIADHHGAIAFTRSCELIQGLARLIPRVEGWDPRPPEASGHVSAWLARPAEALAGLASTDPPILVATREEQAQAERFTDGLPERFVAVHPGSGSFAKNWPAERFAAVLASITERRAWLLIEGPADHEAAAALRRVPGAVLARHLPLRLLGAVLSRALLFLGNDSGVSHLAAAYGAPTVALFAPTDPTVWGPVGRWVRNVRSSTDRMDDISTADVLRIVTEPKAVGASELLA